MNVNVITSENCKITFKPCHAVIQRPCECGPEFEMQYECAGDYIQKKSQAILVVPCFSIPQSDAAVQVLNMA
ncbi:hypothetical protein UNDYM_0771 [Undibacterium sp. YM2]|nr:hypothetical protein UNDYM_0771 [Undibacterium sp. YM2]